VYKTFDELCNDESICGYCKKEPGGYGAANGYISCEVGWCNDAYQEYLEKNRTTETLIRYQENVKLINKECLK
jgi:hypothetical protein